MSRLNYINLFRSKHPDLSDAEIKSHCKLMNIELGMLVDVMATRLSVIKNPSDYDPDDFEGIPIEDVARKKKTCARHPETRS